MTVTCPDEPGMIQVVGDDGKVSVVNFSRMSQSISDRVPAHWKSCFFTTNQFIDDSFFYDVL